MSSDWKLPYMETRTGFRFMRVQTWKRWHFLYGLKKCDTSHLVFHWLPFPWEDISVKVFNWSLQLSIWFEIRLSSLFCLHLNFIRLFSPFLSYSNTLLLNLRKDCYNLSSILFSFLLFFFIIFRLEGSGRVQTLWTRSVICQSSMCSLVHTC